MPFWTKDASTTDTAPKRKFRFLVTFDGINATIGGAALWYAKTAQKPSFSINAAEHKYLNHTFYYPGNVTWNEVTIALVDPAVPDMAATIADIVATGGYNIPSLDSVLTTTTISKGKAVGSLGVVTVAQLDADGKELEKWTLHNAWIRDVKFGDLEYGSDDLTQVDIILRYDWATLVVTGTDGSAATGEGGEGATGASTFFSRAAIE